MKSNPDKDFGYRNYIIDEEDDNNIYW
jgi:hypothetical protein